MIIKFEGKHKSLSSFTSDPINDFTVITGKNGCGKTQLLEIIGSSNVEFIYDKKINSIQRGGIESNNFSVIQGQSWKSDLSKPISDFNSLGSSGKLLMSIFLKNNTWIDELTSENLFDKIKSIDKFELENVIKDTYQNISKSGKVNFIQAFNNLKTHPYFKIDKQVVSLAKYVANYHNKDIADLNSVDFYTTPIPEKYINIKPNLFSSRIDQIFYNYLIRRDLNRKAYFYKKEDGIENESIPDSDFMKKFSPPWDIINEILQKNKLPFKFIGIEPREFSPDFNVSFDFIKTTTNQKISFQHLSSGEKTIIGLIIKLFTSSFYQDNLGFPDLLILDEPDAYLHPEMSNLLIKVLNDTFVNDLGIKVIMVTHSPSTIALCPDDSIYQLINEPITSLKKIDKGEALNLLTEHLPTLSINYKNHKQVFVESPTDVIYYQTIFNKLNEKHKYPYNLYFISNSYGKGNSDQVKKITKELRDFGNDSCYGIIDWDLNNKSNNFIKVHGENKRYSLESYLYDPIYIAVLLMQMEAHNVFSELNLPETTNQYDIGNFDNESLQNISNWFFDKYNKKHKSNTEETDEIKYLNGKKINVPVWYLNFQGHDFEQKIKSLFPAIERKFTSEGLLQKEITKIIGKCYPFIPLDSKKLIDDLMGI